MSIKTTKRIPRIEAYALLFEVMGRMTDEHLGSLLDNLAEEEFAPLTRFDNFLITEEPHASSLEVPPL